jgi:hypothetical protein
MRADGVTPALRQEVLERDGFRCVAPRIAGVAAGYCRNRWNDTVITSGRYPEFALTLDHVKDQPRMGKRAPSDRKHLVTLCWHHHLNGWATAHRPELRAYIALAEGAAT